MNCHKCNGHGDVGCKSCKTSHFHKVEVVKQEHGCQDCYGTGAVVCHFCCGNGNIE
ncbi:hypothetical protein [Alteribacter populi]|uniref:hypothetical protein n=1 Tax=Alteribacter populi TaxID=2011011 RepID=UPI0012FE0880|nr:hypothetical protein [Alteribacter populi]